MALLGAASATGGHSDDVTAATAMPPINTYTSPHFADFMSVHLTASQAAALQPCPAALCFEVLPPSAAADVEVADGAGAAYAGDGAGDCVDCSFEPLPIPTPATHLRQRRVQDASACEEGAESSCVGGEAEGIALTANPGLDRLDQRLRPLDSRFNYVLDGHGVDIYFLDSGLNALHVEFTGRVAAHLARCVVTGEHPTAWDDPIGHGSLVASQAAGTVSGVARAARIIPVRVFDAKNRFRFGDVIAGIDYVVATASQQRDPDGKLRKAMINFSGSAFTSSTLFDAAVTRAVQAGIPFFVSAGNDAGDACSTSPHAAPGAFNVGATSAADDTLASFSNVGRCVHIQAVGVNNTGATKGSTVAMTRASGTSFSCPLVTGVAAAVWSALPQLDVVALYDLLRKLGTRGVVQMSSVSAVYAACTPNLLAYSAPAGLPELQRVLASVLP